MEKNIIKDPIKTNEKNFTTGNIIIGSVSLLIIVVIIIIWLVILNKDRNAPLIINDGTGDKLNKNEVSINQARSGYRYAGLGQACVQDDVEDGVPNLPEAYSSQGCDSLKKHVCIGDLVKGGGICLSEIGGDCTNLYDCIPDATICLNNICSILGTALNQACTNEGDCKKLAGGNNNICDISLGRCKINYYPYDSGCQIDQDCLSGDSSNSPVCLDLGDKGITIESTYEGTNTDEKDVFKVKSPDDENIINFIKVGMIINIVFVSQTYIKRTIETWNKKELEITLENEGSEIDPGFIGKEAELILGISESGKPEKICLSRVPEGIRQPIIGGTLVPCELGLKSSNGYCISSEFPSVLGEICNRNRKDTGNILKCEERKKIIEGVTYDLTCLLDQKRQTDYENNYNVNFKNTADSIPYVGICSYPIADESDGCDPSLNDCKPPYLCISFNDKNNNPMNLCKNKFGEQFCTDGSYCEEGFECVNNFCVGKSDNICFENNDCASKSCSSKRQLYYFDTSSNSYIKIGELSDIQSENVKTSYSKDIDPETNASKKIICWSEIETNITYPEEPINGYNGTTTGEYTGKKAIIDIFTYNSTNNLYDQSKSTINLYPDNPAGKKVFKDIILGPENKIMAIYSKPIETYRERKNRILTVNPTLDGNTLYIELAYNSGYINTDEIVMYIPDNPNFPLINPNIQYKIVPNPDSNNNWSRVIGITPADGSDMEIKNIDVGYGIGWIYSWSNKFSIQVINTSGYYLPLLLNSENFQTGDRIYTDNLNTENKLEIYNHSGIPNDGDTNKATYTSDHYFYLIKSSKSSSFSKLSLGFGTAGAEDIFNFLLTDDYTSSQGSVPFIQGKKFFFQKVVYNVSGGADNYPFNFELYKGMINYSMVLVPEGKENQFIEKSNLYNLINGEWKINGLNDSFSYNFDSLDTTFDNYRDKDGSDYLLINTRMKYLIQERENIDKNSDLTLVQKIKYSLTDSALPEYYTSTVWDTTKTDSNKLSLYFSEENTGVPPRPRELYLNKDIEEEQNTVDKVMNYQLENNISKTNNLNIFTSFKNNQYIPSNVSPTLGIFSKVKKLSYKQEASDNNIPKGSYEGFEDFNTEAIPCGKFVSDEELTGLSADSQNFYYAGQNRIQFRNPDDIDILLRYGSSEIVVYKEGNILIEGSDKQEQFNSLNYGANGDFLNNLWGTSAHNTGNIAWVITDILEYEVGLVEEYIEVKIHINAIIDTSNYGIQRENIAKDERSDWKLYVNNIYPLIYRNIPIVNLESLTLTHRYTNLYNIYDCSALYTGTKRYGDFNSEIEEDENYVLTESRTSYNKILTNNISSSGGGDSKYTVLNVYNGYGVNYNEDNVADSDQSGYQTDYLLNKREYFQPAAMDYNPSLLDVVTELSNDVNLKPFEEITIGYAPSSFASDQPNINERTESTIFPYFYNYNWFWMLFNVTKQGIPPFLAPTAGSFWGKPFISNPSDNQKTGDIPPWANTLITDNFGENDIPVSYVRPLFSGIIRMEKSAGSGNMFALNNLYLSTISKYSFNLENERFYYNTELMKKDNAVSNIWYGYNQDNKPIIVYKHKGSIKLGVTNIPFYPSVNGKVIRTLDESDVRRIRWPDWIRDTGITPDNDTPQIKNIFIKTDKGNFGAKMRYYVYAKINNKDNFLFYFSADNETQDLGDNQIVVLPKSTIEPSSEIEKEISDFKFQDLTNNLFIISGKCE